MYKFVRHPAYTGSILSLLGVSIALKNIPAILIVAICSFVCYQIRINVEEAVLQKYFKEYKLYKEKHTNFFRIYIKIADALEITLVMVLTSYFYEKIKFVE